MKILWRIAMSKKFKFICLMSVIIPILFLLCTPPAIDAAVMSDYCQVPAFVASAVSPNVLLLVDVSGSMGWAAYRQASDRQRFCSGNPNIECDPDDSDDCIRNWGSCTGSGSHKHCSLPNEHGDYKDCHKESDCFRNWGSCTSSTTTVYYGTCSGNETKGCNLDTISNDNGCFSDGSCKCSSTEGTCDPRITYEGYFTPDKYYVLDTDNIYYKNDGYSPSGDPCVIKYTYTCGSKSTSCSGATLTPPDDALNSPAPCSSSKKYYCPNQKGNPTSQTGDCGAGTVGNWLNYVNMSRIDVLRWAMTGGSPSTCDASDWTKCDPRVYNDSGMTGSGKVGNVCKDNLKIDMNETTTHGCILKTNGISGGGGSSSAVSVAVPWTGRIDQGLAFQFEDLSVQPRMGVYFFSGTGVRSNYIYIGDFTASGAKTTYTYQNLLTEVNATTPSDATPTAPAMWDAKHYLSQTTPEYGGIDATSSSKWKSPMYDCDGSGAGANCNYYPCAKNFIMLMSDGLWNRGGAPTATSSCSIDTGYEPHSADPVVPAYQLHKGFTNAVTGVATNITSVYSVGMFVSTDGERALQNTSMYGSFDNSVNTWPSGTSNNYPLTTCTLTDTGGGCGSGKGSNCTAIPTGSHSDWDTNGNGVPDTYFVADDALTIRTNIMDAVLSMLMHVSSGTAAAVLASGEGSGANLIQATYYPRRKFYDASISWTGGIQNLWYYVDPYFTNSNIRADDGDYILNLQTNGTSPNYTDATMKDWIVQLYYDTTDQKAKARLFADANADGSADGSYFNTLDFEDVGNLWEAGKLLWSRAASDRNIFTTCLSGGTCISGTNLMDFSDTNKSSTTFQSWLNAVDETEASQTINYVRGNDKFCTGTATTCSSDTDCTSPATCDTPYRSRTVKLDSTSTTANVWKLGDIVNSTPKIASWVKLNGYDGAYSDTTYKDYTNTTGYKGRGMVFVGSNDGMLHAFNLGLLGLRWNSQTTNQKSTLGKYCSSTTYQACVQNSDCPTSETCKSDTTLGKEQWAFIPENVLPYLEYLKETSYCHIYSVDITPYVFDASIGIDSGVTQPATCSATISGENGYWRCKKTQNSWRTILIGGMRLGGACRDATATCTDCVKTPVTGKGFSEYFALDITDTLNHPNDVANYPPKLLWEFSDSSLGFATSGPSVVRLNSRTKNAGSSSSDGGLTTNGRWFVVFGSGPTGPIDTAEYQFLGKSDQYLKLFILDLNGPNNGSTSTWTDGTDYFVKTTSIPEAFAGSIFNASQDTDQSYDDEAIYIGYTKKATIGTWTDGGVLRLLTNSTLSGENISGIGGTTGLNPDNWVVSEVIDGIGPVTSAVAKLQNTKTKVLWLYFGTGRYFYKTSSSIDDGDNQRYLFGITEPCYVNGEWDSDCFDSSTALYRSFGDLTKVDLSTTAGVTDSEGWYIELDAASGSYKAERVTTDPSTTTTGVVYFTTFKPYIESCTTGGDTAIWAAKYDTGGAAGSLLKGKVLVQLSTGSIEQIDLSTAFTQKGGRKTVGMTGVPPGPPPSLISNPPPVKRVLHIRER